MSAWKAYLIQLSEEYIVLSVFVRFWDVLPPSHTQKKNCVLVLRNQWCISKEKNVTQLYTQNSTIMQG